MRGRGGRAVGDRRHDLRPPRAARRRARRRDRGRRLLARNLRRAGRRPVELDREHQRLAAVRRRRPHRHRQVLCPGRPRRHTGGRRARADDRHLALGVRHRRLDELSHPRRGGVGRGDPRHGHPAAARSQRDVRDDRRRVVARRRHGLARPRQRRLGPAGCRVDARRRRAGRRGVVTAPCTTGCRGRRRSRHRRAHPHQPAAAARAGHHRDPGHQHGAGAEPTAPLRRHRAAAPAGLRPLGSAGGRPQPPGGRPPAQHPLLRRAGRELLRRGDRGRRQRDDPERRPEPGDDARPRRRPHDGHGRHRHVAPCRSRAGSRRAGPLVADERRRRRRRGPRERRGRDGAVVRRARREPVGRPDRRRHGHQPARHHRSQARRAGAEPQRACTTR